MHGDVTLLKQAMLHDPLTGAVCDPEEVWQMTDEMLVAQAQWLPQYRKEIAGREEAPGRRGEERHPRQADRDRKAPPASNQDGRGDEGATAPRPAANAAAADKGKMTSR